jgi:hypothetical protein
VLYVAGARINVVNSENLGSMILSFFVTTFKGTVSHVGYRLYSKSSLTLTVHALKEWRFDLSFPWVSMPYLNSWRVLTL